MNISEITIAIITALVTGIVGFILGGQKARLDYRQELAMKVWEERYMLYKELLELMQLFSLYPSQLGKVSNKDLQQLSEQFRIWYFNGGGLFLAETTRDIYLLLQKKIQGYLNQKQDLEAILDSEEYDLFQKLMSKLRKELSHDLLSRKRTVL